MADDRPGHDEDAELQRVRCVVSAVPDPEIPAVTLADLGILREVERRGADIVVRLTPTYSGCPATVAIRLDVEAALARHALAGVRVETVLSPAWSTDDISEEGRRKLRAYGIAPPTRAAGKGALLFGSQEMTCPRCGSSETSLISEFGSTPCKSLWRCEACQEPFDAFKCL